MPLSFIMLGLGIVMALWPGQWSGLTSKRRQRRLLELESGAPERHFEERRELQAYRPTPRTLLMLRVIGVGIAISAALQLVTELKEQGAEDATRAETRIAMAEAQGAVSTAAAAVARAESLDPVAFAEAEAAVSASEVAVARADRAQDEADRLTGP